MNHYLQHPLTLPVAVLAALALLLGVTQFAVPDSAGAESPPVAGRAPLGRTTVVCPEPSGGRIAAAIAPGGGSGTAVVRTFGGGGDNRTLGTISRRGVTWAATTDDQAPPVLVRARGALAGTLEVEQATNTGTGPGEGLSATSCSRPESSSWFVSDGVRLGSSTVLYLANPDDKPATVRVDVYGPDGPAAPAAGRGVTVPANQRVSIKLGALAPDASIAALHVRSDAGPVVAALRAKAEQGDRAPGVEWVPETAQPRRTLVIPGVPDGSGSRRLLLATPGSSPADVRVQVVTSEGTYAPEHAERQHVSPRTVTSVDLTEALSGRASAVRVTANRPVTAGMVVESNDGLAYAAAVPSLSGRSVVAAGDEGDEGDEGDADVTGTLILSAPMKAGQVRVTMFTEEGTVGRPDVVRVPSARTVEVELSPPPSVDGHYGVVVRPVRGSGPVYGARMLRAEASEKTLLSVLPLRSSSSWVRVPVAEESVGVVNQR